MPLTTKFFPITPDTPETLRKADRAVQSLAATSRSQTVGLFDHGCVRVNGQPCPDPWRRLVVGDTVELRYRPEQRYSPKKKPIAPSGFEILFEDAQVIVVDKPAHLLTVPSPRGEPNTMIQWVANYLAQADQRRRPVVRAVQRLDRGVSGVLVFAKTNEAHQRLRSQFAAHRPRREYLAIVAGTPEPPNGQYRSYLATNPSLARYSTRDRNAGELAITHYRTEKRLGDATLVRVWLETGRRNQIRVHFAEAGYPVLGDPRYGEEQAAHPRWNARRLALHASLLHFEHPATGKTLRFESPLPAEFTRFVGRK